MSDDALFSLDNMSDVDLLVARLISLEVAPDAAAEAVALCGPSVSVEAARETLASLAGGRCVWTECFSTLHDGRAYYYNGSASTWDEPPSHALSSGRLDCACFNLPASAVGAVADALRALQQESRDGRGGWPGARDCAATLLRNAVDSPCEPKFRSLKLGNPKLRDRLLRFGAGVRLLEACGFRRVEQELVLALDAPLAAARCALARLTAAQKLTDDTSQGAQEGAVSAEEAALRRWQKAVFACAACKRLINDGSERAWTGRWDAPQGEFRYSCAACGVSLCEACSDKRAGGQPGIHPPGCALTAHAPLSSRLAAAGASGDGASTATNPWGTFGASVSARSRQRLKERSGM